MTTNLGTVALKTASSALLKALGEKVLGGASDRVSGLAEKLEGIGGDSGESGGSQGSDSGKATKATTIIETIDVGVPLRVAYNQWTEFARFPSFMKKVESVEAEDDDRLKWKAQILWSHRTWEAHIQEQVPDERIVWRSTAQKGHVDGSVTFHELGPRLTRIILVLEYYPQGLFERTGNLWRAQGRRARVELKHFQRHVMTRTILEPDEVEGWRGTIRDGEVVESHEEAMDREADERDDEESSARDEYDDQESEEPEDQEPEGEYVDEDEEPDDGGPEDEAPDDEYEDEESDEESDEEPDEGGPEDEAPEDEAPEDEYEDEEPDEESDEKSDEEPEDEFQEDEEREDEEKDQDRPARRRRSSPTKRAS